MRVVIAEDEILLRRGLALILEKEGIDVVGTAADAQELDAGVREFTPDLVITDIRMPPTYRDEGLEWALTAREQNPSLAIVVLSQYVQRRYAIELLRQSTGHIGYLLKRRISDVRTFSADLRRVAAGGTALDPEVVAIMLERARVINDGVGGLTSRQREVLALMAEGRTNASIASLLLLSEKAIVQHTSNIYRALGLDVDADDHRRVHAVLRYLEG